VRTRTLLPQVNLSNQAPYLLSILYCTLAAFDLPFVLVLVAAACQRPGRGGCACWLAGCRVRAE